jgi:2-polyprenyl-3-methyl-5-hydroxy-6-metoxy-1,4-benzoquinol methylase
MSGESLGGNVVTMDGTKIDQFYSVALEEGLLNKRSRFQFYVSTIFDGVDFAGASVLDVGGGSGMFSFYAACMGASRVVCLEPEAEGSSPELRNSFIQLRTRLNLHGQVILTPATIQSFEPRDSRFDVVILHNSINHLDENACIHLRESEVSRNVYRTILAKIGSLAKGAARLVVVDCSNHNFFALLRIKNPFAPTVDWRKHQAPEVWISLLREAGFDSPIVKWLSFNLLYGVGRALTGNRVASYFTSSDFCLTMTKRGGRCP